MIKFTINDSAFVNISSINVRIDLFCEYWVAITDASIKFYINFALFVSHTNVYLYNYKTTIILVWI